MADDNTNCAQAHQQPPKPSFALEHLNALVGEWTMEGTVPSDPFEVRDVESLLADT